MRNALKILIADRNRHVRDLLHREFAAAGYQVRVAKTGQEVLSICNEEAPDLFILDSELPFLAELAASSASTSFSVATNARAAGESSLSRSQATP